MFWFHNLFSPQTTIKSGSNWELVVWFFSKYSTFTIHIGASIWVSVLISFRFQFELMLKYDLFTLDLLLQYGIEGWTFEIAVNNCYSVRHLTSDKPKKSWRFASKIGLLFKSKEKIEGWLKLTIFKGSFSTGSFFLQEYQGFCNHKVRSDNTI